MTEYTTSPDAVQVFMSSRERTEHWVRSHSPSLQFNSPSSPPSLIEDMSDERESDDESTHSLPPKMLLKYGNGRDIPISHWHYDNSDRARSSSHRDSGSHGSQSRPHTAHHYSHDRSKSGYAAPTYAHRDKRHNVSDSAYYSSIRQAHRTELDFAVSQSPEEIRILPSDPNAPPQPAANRPRRASEPPTHHVSQPSGSRFVEETSTLRHSSHIGGAQPVTYSHSQPLPMQNPYDKYLPHHSHRSSRPPPAIVYAPGGRHPSDHYSPPTMVYAPHKAPGMTYTVSAPNPHSVPQYPRITPSPYPSAHPHLTSVDEESRMARHRSKSPRGPRSRRDGGPRSHTPISEAGSGDSGSTYYVIPVPGQKVKVLVGPDASLYTATSTTKSPPSPRSNSTGFKKPLFSRLFSFASDLSKSSKNSSKSNRRLQRRHSTDASIHSHSRERT
ncbi:hypothetical protein BV22DRAFT_1029288 [Leucogyrophana mollusca]|uniref:Uncharacterized protein n=1 Tax=Leucogyrophana mollusca TaxID=85980 RepID=A0ACB8BWA7_9AGAM|nr:hypothetical protein BV22DRAFT_1029288 [Leucogyrophana mollusca]